MTLTEFLLARIAEDEAAASYASTRGDFDWEQDAGGWWLGFYDHYRRHDPVRVLAECEAKRRIVEVHAHNARWDDTNVGDWARATLELLALPYADHPDYREEWRP